MARVFTYIDGESHFIQSERCWERIHGKGSTLNEVRFQAYPEDNHMLVIEAAKVFWSKFLNIDSSRQTYVTAMTGSDEKIALARIEMREFSLRHLILKEPTELKSSRESRLRDNHVIEKPKCVDASLIVEMIEDGIQRQLFDQCNLFTSDTDYLPVIDYLHRYGKDVRVFGYHSESGSQAKRFKSVVQFVDLEHFLREKCVRQTGAKSRAMRPESHFCGFDCFQLNIHSNSWIAFNQTGSMS